MSISFLARFRVKPEHEADFVALVAPMEANAKHEPATLAYKFYRLTEPHWFAVFESFVDEAADEAHQANPANVEIIKKMVEYMDGGYTREYLFPIDDGN